MPEAGRVLDSNNSRDRRLTLRWLMLLLCAGLSLAAISLVPSGSALAAPAAAAPVVVGGKAIVANTDGDPIRVREGAATRFARIGWAHEGDIVDILAGPTTDSSGIIWYRVQTADTKGWMMAQYLRGAEQSANRDTGASAGGANPTAVPAPASVPARLKGTAIVANTDGDPLRVRSAPNTGGSVIGSLDPGAKVNIEEGPVTDGAGIVWYRITAAGITGWSMARYLAQAESPRATSTPPAAIPARQNAAPTAIAQPAGNTSTGRVSTDQLRQWVAEARAMYPYAESTDKMWRVMMCESGGNPNASNGGRYLGLFQYAPSTWAGSWNPYRQSSIWDARSQIFATAKAWSIGMQGQWSCY